MCACVRTCVCERGGGVKVDDACMYIIKRGRGWGGEGREGGKGGREGGKEDARRIQTAWGGRSQYRHRTAVLIHIIACRPENFCKVKHVPQRKPPLLCHNCDMPNEIR